MTDLKESRITTEVVYKGDFLDVRRDEVLLPNGETGTREWINHPGAVVIIPILPNGEIALIKQFRYAARSEFLALPAGKLDEGEDPKACAFRELEEGRLLNSAGGVHYESKKNPRRRENGPRTGNDISRHEGVLGHLQ